MRTLRIKGVLLARPLQAGAGMSGSARNRERASIVVRSRFRALPLIPPRCARRELRTHEPKSRKVLPSSPPPVQLFRHHELAAPFKF